MIRQQAHNPPLAALLTLAAATTLLAKALGTGALGQEMHAMQISHGRFLFALLGIAAVTVALRARFTRPNLRLHAARSAMGWGGVSLMFAAQVFAALYDAVIFSVLPDVVSVSGALIIPAGAEQLAWREGRLSKQTA